MMQPGEQLELANWENTAIAVPCHYIDDHVTVMVKRDWIAECAWYLKYKLSTSRDHTKRFDKTIELGIDKCVGPDCPIVTKYRHKLIEEEFGKA